MEQGLGNDKSSILVEYQKIGTELQGLSKAIGEGHQAIAAYSKRVEGMQLEAVRLSGELNVYRRMLVGMGVDIQLLERKLGFISQDLSPEEDAKISEEIGNTFSS